MKSDFVIIGLTGALGSGCSTIAKFLSKSLLNYKKDIQSINEAVESQIGKYYRALKGKENRYNSRMQHFDQQFQDVFIEPEDLYHAVLDQEKLDTTEKRLKILNRQLRALLLKRKLFDYYSSVDWPDFKNISMSTLIIKLVVEQSIKKGSEKIGESDEVLRYLKSGNDFLSGAKDQILRFAEENINIIDQYNNLSSYKNYGDLDNGLFCKEIDQFFHGLVSLKKKILESKDVGPEWLQDMGDNLRGTGNAFRPYRPEEKKKFNHLDILADETNKLIKFYRRRLDGKRKNHFVIDSFRNPEEV
jgi:hypothetical protein